MRRERMVGGRQLLTPHMLLQEELISPALGVEIHLPDQIGLGPASPSC